MLKLSVIGNLGADAERKSANGREFVTFRVAHTDKYTAVDGQQTETTTWVSCIMQGNGGNLLPYLTKGTKVFCRGDMSVRIYTYDHQQRAGVNLNVREVELCGGSKQVPSEQTDQSHDDDPF